MSKPICARACHVQLLNGHPSASVIKLPADICLQLGFTSSHHSGLRLTGHVGLSMEAAVQQALAQTRAKTLVVFLNSHGGLEGPMFSIMEQFKRFQQRSRDHRVAMIGTRDVGSAAFSIFLSVPKRDRYSLPYTRFFTHYCWSPVLVRMDIDHAFDIGLGINADAISTEEIICRFARQLSRGSEDVAEHTRKLIKLHREVNRRMERVYDPFAKALGMDNAKHLLMRDRSFQAKDVKRELLNQIIDLPLSVLPRSLSRPRPYRKGSKLDRYIFQLAEKIVHC